MENFSFIYDEKIIVWVRRDIRVKANSQEEALKLLKNKPNLYDDENITFNEDTVLWDTEKAMPVVENGGKATIEIYPGDEVPIRSTMLYNNEES